MPGQGRVRKCWLISNQFHLCRRVNLPRARAFYVDVLGLEFVEESPFALVVRSGSTVIRVTPVDSPLVQTHTILGWSVPDIETQIADLASRGIIPIRYPGMDQNDLGIWLSPSGARGRVVPRPRWEHPLPDPTLTLEQPRHRPTDSLDDLIWKIARHHWRR